MYTQNRLKEAADNHNCPVQNKTEVGTEPGFKVTVHWTYWNNTSVGKIYWLFYHSKYCIMLLVWTFWYFKCAYHAEVDTFHQAESFVVEMKKIFEHNFLLKFTFYDFC